MITKEDYEFLAYENKMFEKFLKSIGLIQEEINEIAVTGKLDKEEPTKSECKFCQKFFYLDNEET